MTRVTRRALLIGGLALTTVGAGSAKLSDPCTLGVASGDPTFDGVVLWTRLAPSPLAEDGMGGMPSVSWRCAGKSLWTNGSGWSSAVARPLRGRSPATASTWTKASFVIEDRRPSLNPV